jgi:hypothetical protein
MRRRDFLLSPALAVLMPQLRSAARLGLGMAAAGTKHKGLALSMVSLANRLNRNTLLDVPTITRPICHRGKPRSTRKIWPSYLPMKKRSRSCIA